MGMYAHVSTSRECLLDPNCTQIRQVPCGQNVRMYSPAPGATFPVGENMQLTHLQRTSSNPQLLDPQQQVIPYPYVVIPHQPVISMPSNMGYTMPHYQLHSGETGHLVCDLSRSSSPGLGSASPAPNVITSVGAPTGAVPCHNLSAI
ncbi:unnamed protein product, partial [Meganyctiphanes norvegica]